MNGEEYYVSGIIDCKSTSKFKACIKSKNEKKNPAAKKNIEGKKKKGKLYKKRDKWWKAIFNQSE